MSLFQVMPPELATMRDVLRWAASRFNEAGVHFGHGTDNAIDEAMALVLQTLHLPFGIPDTLWDSRLTEDEKRHLVGRIRRRILERKPLPYITGEAWFCGLPFYVDERVLVPRSPIAELIEKHFEPWLDESRVDAVLDLCTGSGCIAVACAYAFPHAEVHGADISEEALAVARRNVDRHGLGDQVTLFQSDVFDGLPPEARYDLIVSNPPYVDAEDMDDLPMEFRHEPRLGLAAGDDGLDIVRRILAQAPGRLSDDGVLIIEVGNSAPALEEAFPELPFTWLEFERGGHGVCLLHAADLQVLE